MNRQFEDVFSILEELTPILPAPIYWLDVDGNVLGANPLVLSALGVQHDEYVGRSVYDIYPYEMAHNIKQHNDKVIKVKKILSQEEKVVMPSTQEIKYFTALKAPILDNNGDVMGVVGTSIDITDEKLATKLREDKLQLELKLMTNKLDEQAKFTRLATQVAHDIRAPLAAFETALQNLTVLPPTQRKILCDAIKRIVDIANCLLKHYQETNDQQVKIGTENV